MRWLAILVTDFIKGIMSKQFVGNSGFGTLVMSLLAWAFCSIGLNATEVSDTSVLKWKDGKQAVFVLSFDDSCPSHLDSAIPELEKRGLVGNFYVVTGQGFYPARKMEWETAAKKPSVALANHTFTHSGGANFQSHEDALTL